MIQGFSQKTKTRNVDPVLETEWALIAPLMSTPNRAFFRVLLETGMRTSEALSLRTQDLVDIDGRTAVAFKRLKRGDVVVDKFYVSHQLAFELKALARKHRATIFKFTRVGAWKALKRYCAQANIRQLSPHQFRHTFARKFAKQVQYDYAGNPLSALDHRIMLANMLGHSSTRWVEVYFQPHRSELTESSAQMPDLFRTWV